MRDERRDNVARGDVTLPALVVRDSAIEHNLVVMARYAERHDFLLAPHAKTTMSPALIARQLRAGAFAVTVANVQQARVATAAGAPRVLIANEVVGRSDLAWLASCLHEDGPELTVLVDSPAGLELLIRTLEGGSGRPLRVLLELGAAGGRAGLRSVAAALELADAIRAAPRLILAGVEGYEGNVASQRDPASLARVDAYLEELRSLTLELAARDAFEATPVVVSAGGSKYFDRVAAKLAPARFFPLESALVVRAGCYLTHDHGVYESTSPLALQAVGAGGAALWPALELWAEVLSTPEPGLSILGFGKRDASFDLGLPVPLVRARGNAPPQPFAGAELFKLDDQHGYLRGGDLAVADRVGFGVSHPCTAIDRWRELLLVDDDRGVLEVLATCFR